MPLDPYCQTNASFFQGSKKKEENKEKSGLLNPD
jgi:hypothetical protein